MSISSQTDMGSEALDPVSEGLKALVHERRTSGAPRHEALLLRKDAIAEARKEGIGHKVIAKHFVKHGINVSWRDVLSFCVEVLREPKPKRRRKKPDERKQAKPSHNKTRLAAAPSSATISSKSVFRENHKDL